MAWLDHVYLARTPQDLEFARTYLVNPQVVTKLDPSLIDVAARREDYGRLLAPFTSHFSTLDLVQGLYRMTEHNGQADALRTHPNAADKPAVFRAGLVLPKDQPQALDILVSHQIGADFQLVVKVNGEVLHDQLIDTKLTLPQRGYASIQLSLAKYAGQKVHLEVLNQSNKRASEYAYWKRLEIVNE